MPIEINDSDFDPLELQAAAHRQPIVIEAIPNEQPQAAPVEAPPPKTIDYGLADPWAYLVAVADEAWEQWQCGIKCVNCEAMLVMTSDNKAQAIADLLQALQGWAVILTHEGEQLHCPKCTRVLETAGFHAVKSFT